jgi:HSP20 family protein
MSIDRRQMSGYLPLRDAIDRLFAGSFIAPQMLGSGEGWPPTNLRITEDDVILCMAIPGANPNDMNISVTGDTVTVSGQVSHVDHGPNAHGSSQSQSGGQQSSQPGQPRDQVYFEEIWHGQFQRSFTLPVQVDPNKANASYEHGILTLSLPKSEATKPRKIQVKGQSTIEGQSSGSQSSGGSQASGSMETEKVPVQTGGNSDGSGS